MRIYIASAPHENHIGFENTYSLSSKGVTT
jgi:hypothetical protein